MSLSRFKKPLCLKNWKSNDFLTATEAKKKKIGRNKQTTSRKTQILRQFVENTSVDNLHEKNRKKLHAFENDSVDKLNCKLLFCSQTKSWITCERLIWSHSNFYQWCMLFFANQKQAKIINLQNYRFFIRKRFCWCTAQRSLHNIPRYAEHFEACIHTFSQFIDFW